MILVLIINHLFCRVYGFGGRCHGGELMCIAFYELMYAIMYGVMMF